MHPRAYLLRASDRLTAAAAIDDLGIRASVAAVAARLDDCRQPANAEVARIDRSLGDLEPSVTGAASVTVRRARRDLVRYCEATDGSPPSSSPSSSST